MVLLKILLVYVATAALLICFIRLLLGSRWSKRSAK